MHNVEDVTTVQNGFFPTFFNYGTLKVETAGEQVNFVFTFCPNPGYFANIILNCREKVLGQMAQDEPVSKQPMSSQAQPDTTTADAIKSLGAETVKQASSPENKS
jgi:hypothetical protein